MENSMDELFRTSACEQEDGDTALGPTSSNDLLFNHCSGDQDDHAVEPSSSTADVSAAKEKRRIANRESARRMRQRKVEMLKSLSQEVARLTSRNTMLEVRTKSMARQFSKAKMENQLLRARVQELSVEADTALQRAQLEQLATMGSISTGGFPFPPAPTTQQPLCSPTAPCPPPLTPTATICPPAMPPRAPPALPLDFQAQLQSACHAAALHQAAATAAAYSAFLNPTPTLQPPHSCAMANFLDTPPWPHLPDPQCAPPLVDAPLAPLADHNNPWLW